MENPDERFESIRRMVSHAYNVIAQLLGGLTPPIVVPRLGDTPEAHTRSMDALDKAREIIGDLPVNEQYLTVLRHTILEWATFYELVATIEEAGATPMRVAALEMSGRRLQICFQQLRRLEP